jgi:hypothetical protein
LEDVVIQWGPRELLPTEAELWNACRRGAGFDEDDLYSNPFLKSAAGLVDAYRRCAAIDIDADELFLTWPWHEPVPTAMEVGGRKGEAFGVVSEEILGYLLTIDLDAEHLLPGPRVGAQPHREPLSSVIGRFTFQYATLYSESGCLKEGLTSDQTPVLDAERAYTSLANALAAGVVYLPTSKSPAGEDTR